MTRTHLEILAEWAASLRAEDIPVDVAALAKAQIVNQVAAIRVGRRGAVGAHLVDLAERSGADLPATRAGSWASLGSWLNIDDTAFAGHLGMSCAAAPLAHALDRRAGGAELVRDVVVANECAARITASTTLGPLRGHSALHSHLVAGVVARLSGQMAPTAVWINALSLALSAPSLPVMHAFAASDARALMPGWAVRTGIEAAGAALTGMTGVRDVIEHPQGFCTRLAQVPLPHLASDRLGQQWYLRSLSFKMRPGGPGIDAAVDCALELRASVAADLGVEAILPSQVRRVEVHASAYTVHAAGLARPYLAGSATPVGALVLDAAYPVARALLAGTFGVDDVLAPDDRDAWDLAGRVELHHDRDLTRALLRSDAPFGAALRAAGDAGRLWAIDHLPGVDDRLATESGLPAIELPELETSTKATPARVVVELRDGRRRSSERVIPLGGASAATRESCQKLVHDKVGALGGAAWLPPEGIDRLDAGQLSAWAIPVLSGAL